METQTLIDQQSKRKESFRILVESINSERSVLTRNQFRERLSTLEQIFAEFGNTHQQILKYGKPDIPYIINRSGDQLMDVMLKSIEDFKKTAALEPNTQELLDITLHTGHGDDQNVHDQTFKNPGGIPNATGGQFLQQSIIDEGQGSASVVGSQLLIRKLNYKISKLMETLETIIKELSSTLVWTKELFEVKNRFLFDQWNVISALEEDIIINYNITLDTTRPAYVKMNEVISTMIEKIQHTNSSNNSRRGKLPDLKIPVFNGDYKKWSNFIDIFNTMIHSRQDMPLVEKMEYLKGYAEGEPNKLIKNYLLS